MKFLKIAALSLALAVCQNASALVFLGEDGVTEWTNHKFTYTKEEALKEAIENRKNYGPIIYTLEMQANEPWRPPYFTGDRWDWKEHLHDWKEYF